MACVCVHILVFWAIIWIRIRIKGISWIQIRINVQMISQNVYLSTFSRFGAFIWKLGSGSGSASKWKGRIRIRIIVTIRIRIRIKATKQDLDPHQSYTDPRHWLVLIRPKRRFVRYHTNTLNTAYFFSRFFLFFFLQIRQNKSVSLRIQKLPYSTDKISLAVYY